MLDIRYVRDNQEAVAQAMANRNFPWDAELFASLDEQRREAISAEESLQAERNAASKEIGKLMGAGKKEEAEAAKEQVRQINEKLAEASRAGVKIELVVRSMIFWWGRRTFRATPLRWAKTKAKTPSAVAGARRASSISISSPIGILAPIWTSSILIEAISFRAAVSRCSAAQALVLSARSSTISSIRTRPAVSKNGGRLSS